MTLSERLQSAGASSCPAARPALGRTDAACSRDAMAVGTLPEPSVVTRSRLKDRAATACSTGWALG